MAKKANAKTDETKRLLRRMSAPPTSGVVEKVVRFTNDDVPSYLEGLRRFREESQKTDIYVQ